MNTGKKNRDDETLMTLIAGGDKKAFEELFDREVLGVYKVAYIYMKDKALAEDIAQEAFSRLWVHASKWRAEAKIKTWLVRVTKNLSIDYLRKKKSDLKKVGDLFHSHSIHETGDADDAHIKELEEDRVKEVMKDAVYSLPERQREALTLVYYMNLSGAEASGVMDLTVSAFESLLARGRRNLRKRLSGQRIELMEIVND